MNLVYEQCPHAAARRDRVEGMRALGCRMHLLWSGAGQPHPFTGSEAPPGGQALWVWFSGVVSANTLSDR
jgi:hypothetical protein